MPFSLPQAGGYFAHQNLAHRYMFISVIQCFKEGKSHVEMGKPRREWVTETQSLIFTLLSSSAEKVTAWCWLIIFNYLLISIASPTQYDPLFALPHMYFMMCNLPVSVSVIYKLSICCDAAGLYTGVGRRRRRLCCLPVPPSCSL